MYAPRDIKAIIWDLDNTLYQFTDAFKFSCNKAAAKAAIELGFDAPYEETLQIAVQSSIDHHFSLYVFINQYGMDYKKLHHLFHDYFESDLIQPIHGVVETLENIKLPQVVLTNGSRVWAQRALDTICASHLFKEHEVFALEDVDMVSKVGGITGYKMALSALETHAQETIFIDDLDKNLKKAKEVKLQTAYVHHDKPLDALPDYIDSQHKNPIDLVSDLNLAS